MFMSEFNTCPQCNAQVPSKHLYCGECGFTMSDSPSVNSVNSVEEKWDEDFGLNVEPSMLDLPSPSLTASQSIEAVKQEPMLSAVKKPLFELYVIRSADLPELSHPIHQNSILGRINGDILFKEDPYVSPTHASFFYDQHQLFIKDESSFNGVFVRLKNTIALMPGDFFIAGEQFFQVELTTEQQFSPYLSIDSSDKNTKYFASSMKQSHRFNLIQWLEGGQKGLSLPISEQQLSIGRQGCELNFPIDRFMSSHHCHIALENDRVFLTDLGSRNGTFIQIKGIHAVNLGDFLLIGKQLLQIKPHRG
jgi:pSer/pThr/pTyr-binding forkhead associated (FHA) protein